MPLSRILILAGAVGAFLLMVTSVTSSQEFVYAPEDEWRAASEGSGEDRAVAVWRAQRSTVAVAQVPPTTAPAADDDDGASSAPPASAAASSVPIAASSTAMKQHSSTSDPFVFESRGPWWRHVGDFFDDDDEGDGDRDDGRDGDRREKKKGKRD